MTKKQAGKLDMIALIILFFGKYDAKLNTFAPLMAQADALKAQEVIIKTLLDQQGIKSKGKTLSKEALRELTIELVLPLAQLACGWAIVEGKKELKAIWDIEESDFSITQDDFVVMVDNILKALTDNLTDLLPYDITAAKITEAKNAELDYVNAKEQPKQQKAFTKAVTTALKAEFKKADQILLICDKLIPGRFKKTDLEMVNEYFYDRKVFIAGRRHTTIKVHIYADEEHSIPIEGATFEIIGINRSASTDVHGDGEIVQFTPGSYTLKTKSNGCVDQEIHFSVKSGKSVELDIVMVPNIIKGNVTSATGAPAQECNASIVGTMISTLTDPLGNYELSQVPEGSGFIEMSNPSGDTLRKSFIYTQGQNLIIDFSFKNQGN